MTVEFYGSYGAAEVHATLYPIHSDREVVAFAWRPDQTAVASATNPELEGNVQLLTYSPAATRGEAETLTATFTAADEAGLAYSPPDGRRAQHSGSTGYRESDPGLHPRRQRHEEVVAGRATQDRRPTRQDGECRPLTEIGNMRRVGRAAGYEPASRQRGVRRTEGAEPPNTGAACARRNLADLQMDRALLPALDQNEEQIVRRVRREPRRCRPTTSRQP